MLIPKIMVIVAGTKDTKARRPQVATKGLKRKDGVNLNSVDLAGQVLLSFCRRRQVNSGLLNNGFVYRR